MLFELAEQHGAIAVATAPGLVGLPALAGQLARRWSLTPIDLTLDGDAYAEHDGLPRGLALASAPRPEPGALPRGRVLLGLSLLSRERMIACLARLNRGRDRIHALGLHVVLVIDEADLRTVHEFAPDLASRIHEFVRFDVDRWTPADVGVLSPLGPMPRPGPHADARHLSSLVDALSGLGARVDLRAAADPAVLAADVGWSLAETARARVAWIERGRWDDARCMQWLDELGQPRLLIVLGEGDERFDVRSNIASLLHCPKPTTPTAIDLLPDTSIDARSKAAAARAEHGMIWMLQPAEAPAAAALKAALVARGLVLMGGPHHLFRLRAAAHDDVALVWLSLETLGSPELLRTLDSLRPRDGWRPLARTIVVLDHVDNAKAHELLGPSATTLTFTSPERTAEDIARLLHIPSTSRRLPHRGSPVPELAIALVESGTQVAVREGIGAMTLHASQRPFHAPCPDDPRSDEQLDACARALAALLPTAASELVERFAVEFDDDSPPAWHGLPWELLAARGVSVVRRLTSLTPEPRHYVHEVLRVLVACSDDAAAEVISTALAELGPRAEQRVLVRPSFDALLAQLADADAHGDPFQLLHLHGHGHASPDAAAFVFGPDDQPRLLSSADLAWSLQARGLQACLVEAPAMPPSSLAHDLLRVGILSVVTLHASLASGDRDTFLARFYAAIAAGRTIEAAVSAGRSALHDHGDGPHAWLAPMLFEVGIDSPQLLPPGLVSVDGDARPKP